MRINAWISGYADNIFMLSKMYIVMWIGYFIFCSQIPLSTEKIVYKKCWQFQWYDVLERNMCILEKVLNVHWMGFYLWVIYFEQTKRYIHSQFREEEKGKSVGLIYWR